MNFKLDNHVITAEATRQAAAVVALRYLRIAFAWVEPFIRTAIARAQADDHSPNEALRGLIITDGEIDAHLNRQPMISPWRANSTGQLSLPNFDDQPAASPITRLARIYNLTPIDCAIFTLAAAPEFDRRYERLYAYLQDDVSQRRPTVNLMMNLLGDDAETRFAVRQRLLADQPLRRHRLIECAPEAGQPNASFLAHHLRIDARMTAFLLGDETPDERLTGIITRLLPDSLPIPVPEDTGKVIGRAVWDSALLYMRGVEGIGRRALAAAACVEYDQPLVGVDLAKLAALGVPLMQTWPLAMREAMLAEAGILLHGWDSILDETTGQPPEDLWNALIVYPAVVFICGKSAWEPLDEGRIRRLLRLSFDLPNDAERERLWDVALARLDAEERPKPQITFEELAQIANKFRFTPAQIARAANTAADLAATRGDSISALDLLGGAQAHSSLKLGRLAKQVVARHVWEDLILPPDRLEQLHELRTRAEHTHIVSDEWGFKRKVAPRPGISALFAGESGTGKTMSAEVIANDLGLVMYRIDLSAVVSKYIGETEKNLAVIFEEAHASNAILFFDEADALFGKRSEVKDAHDRYANIETAYLLQQIEDYDGIAILATNLRQNLDEAFSRRLDFVVDFPFPEPEYRQRIWEVHFPANAPLSPEVNLRELAERYPLAGGNIRNAALASAYLAAADGRIITMRHIRHAIRREHQKMGRLVD